MRSAKSVNSLNQIQNHNNIRQQQDQHQQQSQYQYNNSNNNNNQDHYNQNQQLQNGAGQQHLSQDTIKSNHKSNNPATSPICRCRVMYLGSSVPHITKDGLQGIQEPLNVLYPDKVSLASGNAGIDSWLSVWSNGILIENVDESGKEVKKFFKIEALHYCAAVKFVPLALQGNNPYTTLPNGSSIAQMPQFLPLDSPHARQPNPNPPIFASILRRTTGIKVLECHAFICKREAAANALVRCCFHAYADTTYAKQIGADINGVATDLNNDSKHNDSNNNNQNDQISNLSNGSPATLSDSRSQPSTIINGNAMRRAKSIGNFTDEQESQNHKLNKPLSSAELDHTDHPSFSRPKSINGSVMNDSDNNSNNNNNNNNSNLNGLWNQQRFSKSLHHLNDLNERMIQQVNQQSYYNPYASRVPSYPPQNLLDPYSTANGGTLRSIKSMAANSIASTLLRSKKHAKAMSMAQLNQEKLIQQQQQQQNQLQQLQQSNSLILPPIPPMFLPNLANRAILNGSQTMKPVSSSNRLNFLSNNGFEAMTHKEMKKLLKKNAKYGLEPARFPENGLPSASLLPFQPIPSIRSMIPMHHNNKSGTMMTSTSMFSDIYGVQPPPPPPMMRGVPGTPGSNIMHPPLPTSPDQGQGVKQILVKPTAEFLKSKAGKKWLKQQKQFKKLLPPHLDGLPIVFGPPPVEALEAANMPGINQAGIPVSHLLGPHNAPNPHPVGLPMMDSSGYYAQSNNGFNIQHQQHHPGQNGRASAASTLLRYSPQYSQPMHDLMHNPNLHHTDMQHIPDVEAANYQQQQHHHNQLLHHQQQQMQMHLQQPMQMYGMHNGSARSQAPSVMNGHGNHHNGREMMIGGDDSSMAPSDFSQQQHSQPNQRHFPSQRFIMPQQKQRNHMVEQSVISLGDENDYEDDNEDEQQDHYSTPHQARQNSIDEVGLFF